jgi:nicotinic acid phosphoribosyltransferase
VRSSRPPRGKEIFYFPARHDHWLVQTGDGWSAHVAGASGVSTDAQAWWWGRRGIGTVPHGLIAAYGGDTVRAFTPTGFNQRLVQKVRGALDRAGFGEVKIVASGGFTAERIREFEGLGVPVDAYGVGSSLIRGNNDFTADIVLLDGKPCAKVGRWFSPNPRLQPVT